MTLLTGRYTDQAALYGLLRKARDMGMDLLQVNCCGQAPDVSSGKELND